MEHAVAAIQGDLEESIDASVLHRFHFLASNGTVLLFSFRLPANVSRAEAIRRAQGSRFQRLALFLMQLSNPNVTFTKFCVLCVGICEAPSIATCDPAPPEPACNGLCKGGIAFSLVVGAAVLAMVAMVALDASQVFNLLFMFPSLG